MSPCPLRVKTFLLLITLAWPVFKEGQTYTLLSMVADVPFYFMPVFVAFGAARKLGSTPIFSYGLRSIWDR